MNRAGLRTLTDSRQQRALLRLLRSAAGPDGLPIVAEEIVLACVDEGLTPAEAARLAEDVAAARVPVSTTAELFRDLSPVDLVGRVRAGVETAALRAAARRRSGRGGT